MVGIGKQIEACLADESTDEGDDGLTRCELIEELITESNWCAVLDYVLGIIREPRERAHDQQVALEVLWGAALDKRPMAVDRVLAHLCYRWPPGQPEDNLVWSITAKLKSVDYLSEYEASKDPAVILELERIYQGG